MNRIGGWDDRGVAMNDPDRSLICKAAFAPASQCTLFLFLNQVIVDPGSDSFLLMPEVNAVRSCKKSLARVLVKLITAIK